MQELAIAETREDLVDLGQLWVQLAAGLAVLSNTSSAGGRAYAEVTIRRWQRTAAVPAAEALARYFRSGSQKELAYDGNVSAATICSRFSAALAVMAPGPVSSRASILLVAAAHAAAGTFVPPARVEQHLDSHRMLISFEIPGKVLLDRLPPCERDVAAMLIDGMKHQQIAAERKTSVRTTATQLASIFQKLAVSGRAELRSKAIVETANSQPARHAKPLTLPEAERRAAGQRMLRLL